MNHRTWAEGLIKASDGRTLLDGQVQNLVNAMAAFGVPAGGESNLTARDGPFYFA